MFNNNNNNFNQEQEAEANLQILAIWEYKETFHRLTLSPLNRWPN